MQELMYVQEVGGLSPEKNSTTKAVLTRLNQDSGAAAANFASQVIYSMDDDVHICIYPCKF